MTSLKKLIAVLAVSLPLAAAAQTAAPAAPAPLYQWYGTFNVNAQYVEISEPFKAAPATTPANGAGRFGVSTDSTNIGIRGTADLGQMGLSLVYQCETSAAVDGDGIAGICGRNSRLGVASGVFGTLFYGNWDTPYKAAWYGTKADDAFGNTDIFDAAALMGSPGNKTKASAGLSASGPATPAAPATATSNFVPASSSATFAVRAANSIAYWTPKIMGLQARVQWSTNERANLNGTLTGQLWSAALNYDRGPLSVFAAWEQHDDWAGLAAIGALDTAIGANSTKDRGIKFGAGYELPTPFGATTIGAVWERLSFGYVHPSSPNIASGDVKDAHRDAMMFNLKHRMGNHEFRARYTYADNGDCDFKLVGAATGTCNDDIGRGAQNYALGYAYHFTKAAQVYAYFTKIENERNASYTFATAGPPVLTAGWANGADPMGAGLGMRYAF